MINHSALSYDGTGRIRNSLASPDHYVGGVPFIDILLSATLAAITHYRSGLPYGATGRLVSISGGVIAGYTAGGLPVDATGALVTDAAGAITHYNSGLPCTADGSLAFSTPE